MGRILCTNEEIAAVVGCSVDTLTRNFAECLQKARESGKESLRRAQWKKAKAGNPALLIWLGKQCLGQRDKHDVTLSADEARAELASVLGATPEELDRATDTVH